MLISAETALDAPLKRALYDLHSDLEAYYAHWYHERPIAITPARRDELRELHRVVYKCVCHMAERYMDYVPRFMPLSERELEILELQARRPFRAGTFRPDYIIDEGGRLLVCEITSRFFGHGIFSSYFPERVADGFMARFPGKVRESAYEDLLACMLALPGDKKNIYVLKSADKTLEIKLYTPFYRHFGRQVEVIEAPDVEGRIADWRGGFVISALNQRDLLSYSMDTIRAMVDAGMVNDLRTVLLIHDKRFMRLWFEDAFTDRCLTKAETAFLRDHAIPTWPWSENPAAWADARANREGYILKHRRLGKSEQVYGGPLTDPDTWERQWTDGAVQGMILQPFIRQRRFPTLWQGTPFEDYMCGMMLCADDRYFDSGMFRASSLPVINVGDDRKICPIHTDDPELLAACDLL